MLLGNCCRKNETCEKRLTSDKILLELEITDIKPEFTAAITAFCHDVRKSLGENFERKSKIGDRKFHLLVTKSILRTECFALEREIAMFDF